MPWHERPLSLLAKKLVLQRALRLQQDCRHASTCAKERARETETETETEIETDIETGREGERARHRDRRSDRDTRTDRQRDRERWEAMREGGREGEIGRAVKGDAVAGCQAWQKTGMIQ